VALGSGVFASQAFIPGLHAPSVGELVESQALRGASASAPTSAAASDAAAGSKTVVGLSAAMALAATTISRRRARTALRAEPVTATAAAAAAVAAGKASAATGAVKTAAAVAGSATTGSLKKSADDNKSGKSGFVGGAGAAFDPALQIGVTEPLGYFDPLGFCKKGDEKGFRKFRTAEIKHGRAAMMAAVGAVVQHYVKFPGFEGVPSGLGAVNTPPGSYGFIVLFAIAGALELGPWSEKDDRAPGDFGDPVGLNQYTEEMRNRELNNGRAAMFAAIGIIVAELYTGKDAIQQLGA